MSRRLTRYCSALAFTLLTELALAAPVTVTDDSGQTLHLPTPARRIISLAPHLTENLFEIGAGDRIVGTVDYSDFPDAARGIRRIGSSSQLDYEAIAALRPDLVVAWQSGNPPALINKLRRMGLPIYISQPNVISDIPHGLRQLGALAGVSNTSSNVVGQFEQRFHALVRRYAHRPVVRTFYEIWNKPLLTVGGRQIISDALRVCGGANVFEQLTTMAPSVSVEAVLIANPEAIVASGMDTARPEWLEEWQRWPQLMAVQRGNLFFVPPDVMQRHTVRLLGGVQMLCEHLEVARTRR